MANKVKASDCKCCQCGEQAVAFWPFIDPDIPYHPYCQRCLEEAQISLMVAFAEEDTPQKSLL